MDAAAAKQNAMTVSKPREFADFTDYDLRIELQDANEADALRGDGQSEWTRKILQEMEDRLEQVSSTKD
jgi:hypothetical protein